ncbi:AraC family transcriptional regulator [Variovorax sp. J22P168]|uniref:helix-turn-helix domain-containing protein n=1 Tax=Variovorax jilinensis TaxID=3053513 RepID=UPI0025787CA2|nr:AraC family transcriptional regulator [Variovorax sp. J22P168]MDM0015320.1 AraC family transcriptional regulator [Variovorax sp. J22P168]
MDGTNCAPRRLTSYLGVADTPTLFAGTLDKASLFVNRERVGSPGHGLTPLYDLEDAFAVYLHLCDFNRLELWRDGRRMRTAPYVTGAVILYNLDQQWRANMIDPFDCLHFHVTRTAFDEVVDEFGGPRIGMLHCAPEECAVDHVLLGLGQALLPALARPSEANSLFVEHVGISLYIHLATQYGGLQLPHRRRAGALAPWQEKRAKDYLQHHLAEDVSLAHLATECGLSRSHFTRAFRLSTGLPPHRWLLDQRIRMAKHLLVHGEISLIEAAAACGFADQSHFTRSFTRATGISPGAWRRARMH